MRKIFFITLGLFFTCICLSALADVYMPLPDVVNARMFSTEGTRPMVNLEKTYYENQAIKKIEQKHVVEKQEVKKDDVLDEEKKKTTIKDLFKGFVFEY